MRSTCWMVTTFVLLTICGEAAPVLADPIFSIINLGPATDGTSNVKFSTDASGNQVVVNPGGTTAYPFPACPNLLGGMSRADLQNLNSGMRNSFGSHDDFTSSFMNSNGIVVGVENSGLNGRYNSYSTNFAVKLNDGSFSLLQLIPTNLRGDGFPNAQGINTSGFPQFLYGLNNLNQVLGADYTGPYLYNINTK